MEELEVAGYVDTMTLGKKKVLAEIDQEADAIDDLWRHARETKYGNAMEEYTNLWRLLRRIMREIFKDEDGFRAWQRLKQRFEPGLAARHGIVMAECSGMVARLAKIPGETVALLTEMDRKKKLVEDVARSVLVGILDPVTRQHTAVTIRSHVSPSTRSCRSSPTTRRRARKQCRLDLLKQAPLRRRQPGRHQWHRRSRRAGRRMVLSTPWVHNSAGPAKDTVTCPGTVPTAGARAETKTTSARARAHTNGNKGNHDGMYKGVGKANGPSSCGQGTRRRRKVWREGHLMASATPAMEIRTRLPQRWPGRLGKSRHW